MSDEPAGYAVISGLDTQRKFGSSDLRVGATGGVGVQVVQLTASATVAGTSGTEAEAELLRNLGATAVIDRARSSRGSG
jgi:NADPH:quinone reductase-like Zn-dependent oxidoreductase